jgi:hypothetical protein
MKLGMIIGLCGFFAALIGGVLSFTLNGIVGLWMVRLGVLLGWVGALVFIFFKRKQLTKKPDSD